MAETRQRQISKIDSEIMNTSARTFSQNDWSQGYTTKSEYQSHYIGIVRGDEHIRQKQKAKAGISIIMPTRL